MSFLKALLTGGAQVASAYAGYKGAQEANETNVEQAAINRDFNREEAQKTRDFQERMRATQYQTATKDMLAAGINPMVAYTQGGAGTPSGATASNSSLPQIANKASAALANSTATATVQNILAQTDKTKADADVSRAMADKVRAETNLTTSSTGKVQQETINLREQIAEIQARIKLLKQNTASDVQREGLLAAEAGLTAMQQRVEERRMGLVEAQTQLTKIQTDLARYEIAGARNKSASDETFWGRNIRPYIQDAGRVTNSATSIYQLRR
ncbi:DNA pilot protein [Microvirus AZ-2020]|nr:DNA pilot protein [Microvirus AZ-2020]